MLIPRTERNRAEHDLHHWGAVARRRWRAEPRPKHVLTKMQELGVNIPSGYYYDYEPDRWFESVNHVVMRLNPEERVVLVLEFIDRKPWSRVYAELGLRSKWQMKSQIRRAVAAYIEEKQSDTLDCGNESAILA